ncbi:hypothetical protein AB1Y20_016127 [Prymnesium parvum]|uniref:Response regulatory domain-containing protein n=1 Tax=Prymnesium parvum TaxID=97485 RepID=A0AB34K2V5_PRYPA|mmetsp:Transcript_2605/g.6019  ORF Transcript_2605/g.6019 Transcript_2605/m.6019 type:complete len:317 (-) Transcript_2605:583-1533(-)
MPIHTYSLATGVAIARLLEEPSATVADEAAAFAEHARVSLALDNAAMTAAIMFAQPLVKMWQPHWKFAYVIGLCLGVKYTTDGFYIVDILDHVTKEFSLEFLKEGERLALSTVEWTNMSHRSRIFRNALVGVALERPAALLEDPIGSAPVITPPQHPDVHVLIVDDSKIICRVHKACVLALRPNATVHTLSSIQSALEYVRESEDRGHNVNLILLDFCLTTPGGADKPEPVFDEILKLPNGFGVTSALDKEPSEVPRDFRYKPFVAMVSCHAESIALRAKKRGEITGNGTPLGCDALIQKPLTSDSLRVLIEGCGL